MIEIYDLSEEEVCKNNFHTSILFLGRRITVTISKIKIKKMHEHLSHVARNERQRLLPESDGKHRDRTSTSALNKN